MSNRWKLFFSSDNDIALLKLQNNITFTDDIHPACVNLNRDPSHNDAVSVTGWGTLTSQGQTSDVLMEAQVT